MEGDVNYGPKTATIAKVGGITMDASPSEGGVKATCNNCGAEAELTTTFELSSKTTR